MHNSYSQISFTLQLMYVELTHTCSISDVNINTTHIAYPSIQARVWAAVINVDITVCPYPPRSTVTLVPIHHILKQKCTHCPSDCL